MARSSALRTRIGRCLACVILFAGALTGCSPSLTSTSAGCPILCRGSIHGAAYVIRMPKHWNGTLVLFSHGYHDVQSPPTASAGYSTATEANPVAQTLLSRGYALAGSAYDSVGWTVASAVRSDIALYHRFMTLAGRPKRVYAWGSSMGGLITELLAERETWVSGAAPMCGVVGAPERNFDNMLDGVLASQALLGVQLRTGLFVKAALRAEGTRLRAAVARAEADLSGQGGTRLLYLATLLGVPVRHLGGVNSAATVASAGADLTSYVGFALEVLVDLAHRFGGNPADAGGAAIVDRPTAAAADRVALARGTDPGPLRAALASVQPMTAVPAARSALRASGTPTGRIRVPTLTLHTVFDPIVLVANEALLRQQAAAQGRSGLLDQLFVEPPAGEFDPSYGYGHCRFSNRQQLGLIMALNSWVRTRVRPAPATLATDLGPGWDERFALPAWPASTG